MNEALAVTVIQSKNKYKKIKNVKPISEEEVSKLSELPENWKRVRLNDLCFLITDGKHGDCRNHENSGYFFISAKDIFDGKINYANARQIKKEDFEEVHKRTNLQPGDILVTNAGTIGRIAIATVNDKTSKTTFQKSVAIMKKPNSLIDSKYVAYHLENDVERIKLVSKGTAQKNLLLGTMSELIIAICPFPEQCAIVSKIELLFSELDNGIANLKLAQEQLKVYRQAVLEKAFEGELTRKWREQQTDLPDTQNLMEQIRREWEEATKAFGKKTKAVKKLTEAELEELSRLPDGWGWAKLGQIVWSVKDGPHYSPKYVENGVPFISGGNVRPSGIDFSNAKHISKELHEELSRRCKPELNDVLYTKGGTTGIARVNTYDSDFNVWVHVAVLKTIKSIYPFYLQHVLNSYYCYRQSQKYTHGVGNQDLGLTRMILITLPICSFSEQQAVVREIETRLSVCDKVEQDIEENLEKAEALRQSILKKAFEGKLLNERELAEVRRAEDWEPAEVLLDRIKAEREKGNGKSGKYIPEQSKKIIRDDKGLTQQATLQVFEQIDN